ncbi:MAG TPA: HPr family phosphocarrier protein [Candidatus Scybalocola faecavium]|nr:HPr family phosphocarrier protein [Candidatus Scybalocola faecavium]
MVSKTVKVNNSLGIHLRPAGKLADAGMKFSCAIHLVRNEKVVNGKSLLSILSLGIKKGYEVEIQCDGKDEQEALDTFVKILEESDAGDA